MSPGRAASTLPGPGRLLSGDGGSWHRRRLVWLLFGVYLLDRADRTLVGALAPSLKAAFTLSNVQIGVLGTVFAIVGTAATLPFGQLTDRTRRTTMLGVALLTWSVAMLITGAATTLGILIAGRAMLGIVTAAAGPAVPSLTGDLVPGEQRSRAMAVVDSGQVVGIGVGYVVAGVLGAVLDWRWAFWILALPAVALGVALLRASEPERGGGQEVERRELSLPAGTQPRPELEIGNEAENMSFLQSARYVLRVRTNVVVILATGIGQYFFAGLSTFAVLYVTQQYGINQLAADLALPIIAVGAFAGMFGGARVADRLLGEGHSRARVYTGAVAFTGAAVCALPAILTRSLLVAVPLILLGVTFLNAATPTLDAVRLDVIDPRMRGRSEAVRHVVLTCVEGSAPLAFGLLADNLAGGGHAGLQAAFLVSLPALLLNGVVLLAAARSYPREVASAQASSEQGR